MANSFGIHLAIIPDGNRRWAARQALKPWDGHRRALENARDLIDWCRQDPRIDILTLWGFSTENWNRDSVEIKHLMQLFEEFLIKERAEFHKHQTKFLHSGRRDRIPNSLAALITELETETATYNEFTFHIALDYGGRDEIVRAVSKLPKSADITPETIRAYFDHPEVPDLDFIIRTSGEQRTSGFFIWQAAYAEWKFVDKYFPDFTTADLKQSVEEFEQRNRRFGA